MKYYYKKISGNTYIRVSVENGEVKDAEKITKEEYLKYISTESVIYEKL